MGAIHGVRFTGFIGAVYQQFPFPAREEDFRQNPSGNQTRAVMEKTMAPFGARIQVQVKTGALGHIGPFQFEPPVFQELLWYVWQGGYPRWKDQVRPGYVMEMNQALQKSKNPFFQGMF
jgi:hypothetical protein